MEVHTECERDLMTFKMTIFLDIKLKKLSLQQSSQFSYRNTRIGKKFVSKEKKLT